MMKRNELTNYLKKFTCMALVTGFVLSSTTTAFASEKVSYSDEEIDFELLADGISEKQKLDAEYAKIGVNLDELLSLPVREDFQQAGEAYVQEALSNTPAVYNAEDDARTLEADRIAYAGKMAYWSKTKNPSVNVQRETLYMYLSHYVDVREPLAESNGIDINSNRSNIWAKYITDYDRQTYDLYISKGISKEKFKAFTDTILFVSGNKGTFENGVNFAKGLRTNIASQIADLSVNGIITYDDGAELFKTYKNATTSGASIEDTVALLTEQLAPKQGIDSKSIAKQFVGLLMAPTPLTLYGMAVSFYAELGYNLMDRANFLAMRSYFNFRMYDRMNYKYQIG